MPKFPSTMEAALSLPLLLALGALWAGEWEPSKGGNTQNFGPLGVHGWVSQQIINKSTVPRRGLMEELSAAPKRR